MRQTQIYSLIAIFVFSLVFQNNGLVQAAAVNPLAVQNQTAGPASKIVVKVVELAAPATIILTRQKQPSAISLDCPLSASINLNEPANCFSLQIARQAPVLPKVAVVFLPAVSVKISVLAPHLFLSTPNLSAAGATGQLPVLPLMVFSLYVAYELAKRKILTKARKLFTYQAVPNLNLARLQVLRC